MQKTECTNTITLQLTRKYLQYFQKAELSISRAGLEVNANVTIISRADLDVHACLLSDIFSEYMGTA